MKRNSLLASLHCRTACLSLPLGYATTRRWTMVSLKPTDANHFATLSNSSAFHRTSRTYWPIMLFSFAGPCRCQCGISHAKRIERSRHWSSNHVKLQTIESKLYVFISFVQIDYFVSIAIQPTTTSVARWNVVCAPPFQFSLDRLNRYASIK